MNSWMVGVGPLEVGIFIYLLVLFSYGVLEFRGGFTASGCGIERGHICFSRLFRATTEAVRVDGRLGTCKGRYFRPFNTSHNQPIPTPLKGLGIGGFSLCSLSNVEVMIVPFCMFSSCVFDSIRGACFNFCALVFCVIFSGLGVGISETPFQVFVFWDFSN